MRRMCRLLMVVVLVALAASCGSTTSEDSLVLQLLRFDDENINQSDIISGDAEVDVVQSCCAVDPVSLFCTDVEPFTQTFANAIFQNNQGLDITIERYEVEIVGSSVGVFEGFSGQTVTGRRCDNEPTRSCGGDSDCFVAGAPGICRSSQTPINILLFDFTTKQLIIPDVEPFGRTFPIEVRFEGTDLAGGKWQVSRDFQARFDNFDNCQVSG